jgi:hypothetical protein
MLAPSVRDRAPDMGTRALTVSANQLATADARNLGYVNDTTRENASPTQPNAPVGYVDHSPKPHS